MKKLICATAILFAAISSSFAQDGDAAFQKGSSTVSLGYGFASPYKSLFKLSNIFATDPTTSTKLSSLGPIGLTYEYGATDKISVGLQVAYGTIKNVTTDKDGLGAGKDYIITQKMDQVSAVARVNYHFGSSDKFDPYGGLGLGYGNFKFKTTTNDPTDVAADFALFNIKVPGALGITGQLGAKYYFSPNFGAYAEIGYLAGSFAQVGVTAKF
jgi:outer membrane protein W